MSQNSEKASYFADDGFTLGFARGVSLVNLKIHHSEGQLGLILVHLIFNWYEVGDEARC